MNDLKRAYMQRRLQGEAPEAIWASFLQANEAKLAEAIQEQVSEALNTTRQLKEAATQWHATLNAKIPGKEEGGTLGAIDQRINEIAIDSLALMKNISQLEEAQCEVAKAREATVQELQDLQTRARAPVAKKSPIPGGWHESNKRAGK